MHQVRPNQPIGDYNQNDSISYNNRRNDYIPQNNRQDPQRRKPSYPQDSYGMSYSNTNNDFKYSNQNASYGAQNRNANPQSSSWQAPQKFPQNNRNMNQRNVMNESDISQYDINQKQESINRKSKRLVKRFLTDYLMWILAILIIIFVLVFMRAFLVPSGSMIPTLQEGDRIFTLIQYFPNGQTYQPGDIVCFTAPSGDTYVKRVVANGGDVVEITGDTLYVNGEESPYQGKGTGAVTGTWVLGEDEYFVMGDNRANSADSRYIGPVSADKMISKVYAIYFPFNHFSWLG